MAFFRPWAWLSSEERKQRKEEILEKIEEAKELLQDAIDNDPDEEEEEDWDDEEEEQEEEYEYEKPYKSLILTDDSVSVVLNDGSTLVKNNVDYEFYLDVKGCESEDDVLDLFVPTGNATSKGQEPVPVTLETEEERRMVSENLAVLRNHKDFKIVGTEVYLNGVNLPMPATIAASFIEVVERWMLTTDVQENVELQEKYQALKMFWMWTAMNPIESSRRDLLSFIRKNDIRITKNGLLEMYRRVVSKGSRSKELINFASNAFYRVSKWGKEASNFEIISKDGEYMLHTRLTTVPDGWSVEGTVEDVYNNLPSMKENSFTDAHTRTMDIKVGEVYAIPEEQIDLNNLEACSAGLHVGSRSFMFSGFGDVGVLALVNPSKVRAVPLYDHSKMRVSEMFIAAVVDLDEYSKSVDEKDLVDFSNKYFSMSVDELTKAVQNRDFSTFNCQGNVVDLNVLDIAEIVKVLESKVVEIV